MIWESLRVTGAIVETTNVGVEEIALGGGGHGERTMGSPK